MSNEQWYREVYLPNLGSNTGETMFNFAKNLNWMEQPEQHSYRIYLVTSKNEKGQYEADFHFYISEKQFDDTDWRICQIPDKRLPTVYCGKSLLRDSDFPIKYPLKTDIKELHSNKIVTNINIKSAYVPAYDTESFVKRKKSGRSRGDNYEISEEDISDFYGKTDSRRVNKTVKHLSSTNPKKKVFTRPSKRRREYILERDGYKCLKCGTDKSLVVDHIFPLGLGGNHAYDNLQTLCKKCDGEKGCKHINYRKSNDIFPNDFPDFPPADKTIRDYVNL